MKYETRTSHLTSSNEVVFLSSQLTTPTLIGKLHSNIMVYTRKTALFALYEKILILKRHQQKLKLN